MSWNSIVITLCLLLAAFALYREYRRESKAHLLWRLLANITAIITLACIALPLKYTTSVTTIGPRKTLLTAGFNADSLSKTDSIYTLDKSVHQQYPKAKLLDNAQQLFTDSAHITPLHIYGYGLTDAELKSLSGQPLIFHPSPAPEGITAISWTCKIKSGQQFIAQGAYKNTSAKACKLLLKGAGTTLDSINIPANNSSAFTLKSLPKNNGRAVYNLVALNGKDTVQHEQLPLIIEPTQPLKVLILSSSPDFETKFLRNWLGGNGYGVASRSVITTGKFGQEYLNMDKPDLTHISAPLLNKFDVVIGDLSALKGLSSSESSALQQEVSQKGLGLIIRADSSDKKSSWLQSYFPVNYQAGKQAGASALILQGNEKTDKLMLSPVYLIAQSNTQPLITDEHNHLLADLTINGAGKMISTTIGNTYSWMLAGNKTDYTALWSLLINKAARKSQAAENWSVSTSLPAINQAVQLTLESAFTCRRYHHK
jgi:hypothetical protein